MSASESDWEAFYDKLTSNPYYLGTPNVLENVTWSRIGHANMLVDKGLASTSSNKGRRALEPVKLEVVATMSANGTDCWLTPCGFWAGPEQYTPKFSDLKLRCRLVAPDHEDRPIFTQDFQAAVRNLETLMSEVETKEYRQAGVLPAERTSIRLRHKVFEPKATNEEDVEGAFPLREWPVKSEAARVALREMDSTHRVNPIPVYNLDGHLVPPSQYMIVLEGAVVRANFTLSHWRITDGKDNRDTYAADICALRVIDPPPPRTPLPKKRTLSPVDSGPSPIKKRKVKVERLR